jgi:hypothetical protein
MRESSRSSAPQRAKPRKPGLQLDLQDRNTQKFTSSIVDRILAKGVGDRASDIHIEPTNPPAHPLSHRRNFLVVVSGNTVLSCWELGQTPEHPITAEFDIGTSVAIIRSDHDVLHRKPARISDRQTVVALVALTG